MAAQAYEGWAGRKETLAQFKDDKSTLEVPWLVFNAADEAEVKAAVLAASDPVIDEMARKAVELTERVNPTIWRVTVTYEELLNQQEKDEKEAREAAGGGGVLSFDTGGGTAHITNSFKTIGIFPNTEVDYRGAIGYDGTRVQGVDVAVPVFNFTVEVQLAPEVVTPAYIRKLMDMTSKVNSDEFSVRLLGAVDNELPTWQPGEVLFLGASGAREGLGDWKVTLRFAAQPNRIDTPQNPFKVGDITVTSKDGWDYLWAAYNKEFTVEPKPPATIYTASAVYIERVYERTAFSPLGLA